MPYLSTEKIINAANEPDIKLSGSSSMFYDEETGEIRHTHKDIAFTTEYFTEMFENELTGTVDIEKVRRDIKKNKKPASGKKRKSEGYVLNKSKLRDKINAYALLEPSQKFLAFYSISFPARLSDFHAYKAFNNWLTRCRQELGLNSYLWVAERQKNNTIHFHLITNNHMNIRDANYFMKRTLLSYSKKGILKRYYTDYNGVDVERVTGNISKLSAYLSKYISKNNTTMKRLPYHSSRNISKLFTKTRITKKKMKELSDLTRHHIETEYFDILYLNFADELIQEQTTLIAVNNEIYKTNTL